MTERAQHIETLKQFRLVFSEGHGFSRAEVAAFDYAIAALLTEEQEVTRLKILVGKLGLQLDASEQRIAHARKQGEANGFQQGWHAALQRMRDGDKIHDLLELVPKFNAATALLTEATTPDDHLDIYAPGEWRCPQCSFCLSKMTLNVKSGDVGVSGHDVFNGEPCPNDGTPMVKVTWRERAGENYGAYVKLVDDVCAAAKADHLPGALAKIAALQSPPAPSATVAEAIRLAKMATNGWACFARTAIEHDAVTKLHQDIDALLAAVRAEETK